MISSILYAALVFAVLVVVHEAGHFAMAKKVGVRVLRFSVGYPPKVFGFRRGETEYSIGATPFGGYVRMLGDEVGEKPTPDEIKLYLHEIGLDLIGAAREHGAVLDAADFDDNLRTLAERLSASGAGVAQTILGRELKPDEALLLNEVRGQPKVDDAIKTLAEHPPTVLVEAYCKRAFPTQSLGKRILIVLAGPLSNIIFAPLLLTFVFMYGVPQLLPVVGKTTKDLPAAKAGLQIGDRILSVNGQPMETWADFSKTVKAGDGSPVKLEIERQQKGQSAHSTIVITPTRLDQKTIYGTNATTWVIGVQPSGDEIAKRYGPIGAVQRGVRNFGRDDRSDGRRNRQYLHRQHAGERGARRSDHDRADGRPGGASRIREPRDVHRDAEPRTRHHKSAAGAAARRRASAVLRLRGYQGQAARTSLSRGDAPGWTVFARGADGVRNLQ